MTLEVKHATLVNASTYPDDASKPVGTGEWNEAHTITMAADRLIGRVTAGSGAAEELTAEQAKALIGVNYAVATTIASLKALTTTNATVAVLSHPYRAGVFQRVLYADYTALVAADTNNLLIARSTHDTSYCWLRQGARSDASDLNIMWAMEAADLADIGPLVTKCRTLATSMGVMGSIGAPGGIIYIPSGEWNWTTNAVALVSNMTLLGDKGGTVVVFGASMNHSFPCLRAVAVPGDVPNYSYENIHVRGITFDSRSRTFKAWLSKADGTPVTDPENDYVMGTGALASGISGVDITATLTSGKVTALTIVNGGSGWNGHPTFPYLPTTVRLRFTGGGSPKKIAYGYATISGGTITSTTIEYGGLGYSSAPTVTTAGGYADIDLLMDPSVDRRNGAAYDETVGIVIQTVQVDKGSITDCTFLDGAQIIQALGCRDFYVSSNTFVNCTKPDRVNFHVTMGDYLTTIGDRNHCLDNIATGGRRVFAAMTCSGQQRLANNMVEGCALLQAGQGTGSTVNGRFLVEGNTCRNVTYVNYGAQCFELINAKNIHFLRNKFEDVDNQVGGMIGCKDLLFAGNTYRNICRDTGTRMAGFTSESEREDEGAGTLPMVFKLTDASTPSALMIGNNGAIGAENLTFLDETMIDGRTVAGGDELPGYLRWYRVGASSANKARNIRVKRIKLLEPTNWGNNADIPLFEPNSATSYSDVMETKMSLFVSEISDRDWEGAKAMSHAVTGTGNVTINVGFRPSRIEFHAADSPGNGRAQFSVVVWDRSKTNGAGYLGSVLTYENTAGAQYYAAQNLRAFRIIDSAGTEILGATIVNWTYTGFVMSILTATITPTVYFVCYP